MQQFCLQVLLGSRPSKPIDVRERNVECWVQLAMLSTTDCGRRIEWVAVCIREPATVNCFTLQHTAPTCTLRRVHSLYPPKEAEMSILAQNRILFMYARPGVMMFPYCNLYGRRYVRASFLSGQRARDCSNWPPSPGFEELHRTRLLPVSPLKGLV